MDSIKIGPFTFKLFYSACPKDSDGNKVDGILWHSKSEIEIDNFLHAQPKVQTVLHEIVHEIAIQAGQDLTEGMVDAIAFGWYQVMRDNPDLVKMITK
jgi:hypothetical protein